MAYSPLQLANAFLQTGELTDARQVLADYFSADRVLSDDADHEQALRLWLDLLAHGDEPDQRLAIQEYDRLPNLSPTDHIKRAMLHYRLGEVSLARGILQTAMTNHPSDERLCESLLFIYQKMGDAPAGLSLIKTKSQKWIWSRWGGDFAMIARDFATAIVYYGEALAMIKTRYALPDDSPAKILDAPTITSAEGLTIMGIYAELLLARAEAYRQNGQLEEAKADEARAKRLIPNDPTI
jgi:tetratricopeptide (TPR) repeat protein